VVAASSCSWAGAIAAHCSAGTGLLLNALLLLPCAVAFGLSVDTLLLLLPVPCAGGCHLPHPELLQHQHYMLHQVRGLCDALMGLAAVLLVPWWCLACPWLVLAYLGCIC
jgi:hypothetical protein